VLSSVVEFSITFRRGGVQVAGVASKQIGAVDAPCATERSFIYD
jgi:hypothetical protein